MDTTEYLKKLYGVNNVEPKEKTITMSMIEYRIELALDVIEKKLNRRQRNV